MALEAFSRGTFGEVLAANWRYDWYLTLSISQIGYQLAVLGRLLFGLGIARTLDLGNLGEHRILLRRVLLAGASRGNDRKHPVCRQPPRPPARVTRSWRFFDGC